MEKNKFIVPLIEVVNLKEDIICTSEAPEDPFDPFDPGGGGFDPYGV